MVIGPEKLWRWFCRNYYKLLDDTLVIQSEIHLLVEIEYKTTVIVNYKKKLERMSTILGFQEYQENYPR